MTRNAHNEKASVKQRDCRGGYSTVDGQTVRDALWIPCKRAGCSDRAARLLHAGHG